MIEDALWKRLAACVGPQVCRESKRLIYRQVGLDVEHGCSNHLAFFEDMATTTVEHTVYAANSILRTLQKNIKIDDITIGLEIFNLQPKCISFRGR